MENEATRTVSEEISIEDMVCFLKRNKRLIIFGGLAGLLFSAAYVTFAQKKYEARWVVQMARTVSSSNNSYSYSYSNSEEPAALIQRLRTPTAYPLEVRGACGLHDDGDYNDYLDGMLKIDIVKNVSHAVEMRVTASSPNQAIKCAEALSAMIVTQQRDLIREHLTGRQAQLLEYQRSLAEEMQQLEKIKKSELGNFGYLAKLDRLSWLRARIDALQEEGLLSQMYPAKLAAPIYAPSKQVSPKVKTVLPLGGLLGLLMGVLYVLGRKWHRGG